MRNLLVDKNGDTDELVIFGLIAMVSMAIATVHMVWTGKLLDLYAVGGGFALVITATGTAIGARDGWNKKEREDARTP